MSTWITTLKKGHSIFVVRFFVIWPFWHMTCFIIAPPCHKTHTHTNTQADHRGVICHQSATASLWASAWVTTLSILHGNLPASIFTFRHFIALFAYFLSYFNFGSSRRSCFAKYLRFLWPDPPSSNSTCFCFQKYSSAHAPTLTSTRTLPLTSTPTQTLELTHWVLHAIIVSAVLAVLKLARKIADAVTKDKRHKQRVEGGQS